MSEVLSIIDVNDYGLQSMTTGQGGGGGSQPNLQSKDVTINQNGTTRIEADTGYDGLSDVDVTVSGILDTSDANATAGDIAQGKTAYVNGVKLTGTASGGGSGLDWSAIGLNSSQSGQPVSIEEGYQQALDILQNWDEYSSVINDFTQPDGMPNERLMLFPSVDISAYQQAGYGAFAGCTGLVEIGQLNMTVTDHSMAEMFLNCKSLRYVPVLPTWTVTDMTNMFQGCTALTDACLDNIVQMCIHAANETTKSFANLGFNEFETFGQYALNYVDTNWGGDLADAGWSVY